MKGTSPSQEDQLTGGGPSARRSPAREEQKKEGKAVEVTAVPGATGIAGSPLAAWGW